LPRRVFENNGYRKVLPIENPVTGELYPLFSDIVSSSSHFGIGIGTYFAQIILLACIMGIAGKFTNNKLDK
jgi:hypothetical protein